MHAKLKQRKVRNRPKSRPQDAQVLLDHAIADHDLVILIDNLSICRALDQYLALYAPIRTIAIITVFDIQHIAHISRTFIVSMAEMAKMASIYATYECSDHLVYLSKEEHYPSLWQYVKAGILTEEEAFKALFA